MLVKIYVLKHPETLEVRYIGRTKNKLNVRLNGHMSKAKKAIRKTHKDNWILSLNQKPIIECIEEVEGWSESYLREQQLISEYLEKGVHLVNLHDRGEGGLLRVISKKQKRKISKKLKQLYEEGKLSCGRKKVTLFKLSGEKVKSFNSYKECAKYLKISEKHFSNSFRRDKRIKNYQIREGVLDCIEPYKNPRKGKNIFCYDNQTKEIIDFSSVNNTIKYLKISPRDFYKCLNTNNLIKNRFVITDARIKLGELLETPEEDNQQPSQT